MNESTTRRRIDKRSLARREPKLRFQGVDNVFALPLLTIADPFDVAFNALFDVATPDLERLRNAIDALIEDRAPKEAA